MEEDNGIESTTNSIISISRNQSKTDIADEWKITVGGKDLEECYEYMKKCLGLIPKGRKK